MSNGIKRRISLGIAQESAYGVQTGLSSTYFLPNVEASLEEITDYAENVAMMGSDYEVNAIKKKFSYVNFSMKMKVDENVLPVFFRQKFTDTVTTITGETVVYSHALAYNESQVVSTGMSSCLYWNDPDRGDLKINGARFSALNLIADKEYLYLQVEGMGMATVATGLTVAINGIREFVGRNGKFEYATATGTYGTQKILSANLNHAFNLSDVEDNIALGDSTFSSLITRQTRFEAEISLLQEDYTLKDIYNAGTKEKFQFTFADTDRIVTGSVTSKKPSIIVEYPAGYIRNFKQSGGTNDLVKQDLTLLAVDDPAIATSPAKITIVNSVATYL